MADNANKMGTRSPSARRAWIEIWSCRGPACQPWVALRTEGVDRNTCADGSVWTYNVALRTEGVDRNKTWGGVGKLA